MDQSINSVLRRIRKRRCDRGMERNKDLSFPPSAWGLLTLTSGQPLTFLLCSWLAKQAQVGPPPYSPHCDQEHCSRYTSHPFPASQMPLPSLLPEVWNQVNRIMLAYTRTLQQTGYKIYKSFHIYVFYIKSDKVMFLGRIQVADK